MIKANNAPNIPNKSKIPQLDMPTALSSIDQIIAVIERNKMAKPTNNARVTTVISGRAISNIPISRSAMPAANDQPQPEINFLLAAAQMIPRKPEMTKVEANSMGKARKEAAGVENTHIPTKIKRMPSKKGAYQCLLGPWL